MESRRHSLEVGLETGLQAGGHEFRPSPTISLTCHGVWAGHGAMDEGSGRGKWRGGQGVQARSLWGRGRKALVGLP